MIKDTLARISAAQNSVILPNGKVISRLEMAFLLIFGVLPEDIIAAANEPKIESVMDDLTGEVDHANRIIMNAAGFPEHVINDTLNHLRDKRIVENARRAARDAKFRGELKDRAALGNLEAQATLDRLTKDKAIESAVKRALADPDQRAIIMRSASPEIRQALLEAAAAQKSGQ